MQNVSLRRSLSILATIALVGCPSDDENATGTASGTESDTENTEESDEESESDEASNSNSNTMASDSASSGSSEETVNPDTSATDTSVTESESESDPTSSSSSASESESESETDPTSSSSGASASETDTDSGSSSESTGAVSASESDSDPTTDSDSDSDTSPPDCEAPGELITCDAIADMPTQFQAMGLGCVGEANQVIPIENEVFSSAAGAWRVATQFGSFIDPGTNEPLWAAREGDQMLIISTGAISAPNAQTGIVTMNPSVHEVGVGNANPDGQQLPAPMSPNDGGLGGPFTNCDGIGDCSNTIEAQWNTGGNAANDLLWMQFDTAVPGGTHGYSFDFAYFSAEFPEFVDTAFNDIFLAWSASETYTGNLCFINDQPCTVTALCDADQTCPNLAYCDEQGCANLAGNELAGTGFDGIGGSTGWFTASGSAEPLETLQLTFAVFDMTDSIYDTAVLLDNWRWDCEGCVPSEVMGCGIEPTP